MLTTSTAESRSPPQPILGGREAVHLLRAYESVLALRPLLVGNQDFLELLLSSCKALGRLVEDGSPDMPAQLASLLASWLSRQNGANARETAAEIVRVIDDHEGASHRTSSLFLRGLAPLEHEYGAVSIVFGPGIGLGDEVTFAQLVRSVVDAYPRARVSIYTLYPGLWRSLVPRVREQPYRGDPLRPFCGIVDPPVRGRQLVVFADFDLFEISTRVLAARPWRDVVELALGRAEARFVGGTSPWVRYEEFCSSAHNNYAVVRAFAERLFPRPQPRLAWDPIARPRFHVRSRRRLIVNPFSSKPLPLAPEDWARFVAATRRQLTTPAAVDAIVYPGLSNRTHAYAAASVELMTDSGTHARTLGSGDASAINPFDALPRLVVALRHADLCLTLDTFTAHLAPLLGVPTIVVAYADNTRFWAPGDWCFHTVLDAAEGEVPPLAALLLNRPPPSAPGWRSAAHLVVATQKAATEGLDAESIAAILGPLPRVLQQLDSLPYQAEGRHWLTVWSRLRSAVRRESADTRQLHAYVEAWCSTRFYKALATVVCGWSRNGWGPAA
jgi:hypothetical protein